MRLVSDLIFHLARATGRGFPTGFDGELEIPGGLSPVITIPGALVSINGFSSTDNQRESFVRSTVNAQAASSAADAVRLATLGRGLWRIFWTFTSIVSFTQVFTDEFFARLRIADEDATTMNIVVHPAVANVPLNSQGSFDILLPRDDWAIDLFMEATGVGQTGRSSAFVVASRLA